MADVMTHVATADHGDGVRLVTLTDPDRRNAMSEAMGAELREVVASSAVDGTRVLVVTGEGAAFCAGADLPALFGDPSKPTRAIRDRLNAYYRAFLDVRDLAIPTVAAVNGPAVGAGLNLALACDLRVAGPEASFGATFTRIGLHPGGGCTWFLVEALGAHRAMRTLLLGETLTVAEAAATGLADGPVEDPLSDALELAGRLASSDPGLVADVKRSVRVAVETGSLQATQEIEAWAQAASASSERLQTWVDRFR